jgi:DnaJ-class molecular chaperone
MKKCKWCNGTGRKLKNIPGIKWLGLDPIFIKSPCQKCFGKGVK